MNTNKTSRIIYALATGTQGQSSKTTERCFLCGEPAQVGKSKKDVVKDTFMDYDKVGCMTSTIVCDACCFLLEEKNDVLTARTGQERPQKMRNYSHFVTDGKWLPLSKGDKAKMREILLSPVGFPELAIIADSGQKHIFFHARVNMPNQPAGFVTFEDKTFWLTQHDLADTLDVIHRLVEFGFNKSQIETGTYPQHYVIASGRDRGRLSKWQELEAQARPLRNKLHWRLAIFLAKPRELERSDEHERDAIRDGNQPARQSLVGNGQGVQETLRNEHLGAVPEHGEGVRLHEQTDEVHQRHLLQT